MQAGALVSEIVSPLRLAHRLVEFLMGLELNLEPVQLMGSGEVSEVAPQQGALQVSI